MKKLFLDSDLRQIMEDDVQRVFPEEACGIIGGHQDRARLVLPVENHLHSATRFEMDPLEQLRAMETIEQAGFTILAFFHSHPHGPNHPSHTDLAEFAYPGVVYLIWYREENGWQVKGFEVNKDNYAELDLDFGVSTYANGGKLNVV